MPQPGHSNVRNSVSEPIQFSATLHRPLSPSRASWMFLRLPSHASNALPSRGQVTVEGLFKEVPLLATLAPDGQGGHWLKVDLDLLNASNAREGDVVALSIAPVPTEREPEPLVPVELRKALASAPQKTRDAWSSITPVARRDWIHWITSAKQEATRVRRTNACCDMLAKGKRRPCCFDRSGMYSKSMNCPEPRDKNQA